MLFCWNDTWAYMRFKDYLLGILCCFKCENKTIGRCLRASETCAPFPSLLATVRRPIENIHKYSRLFWNISWNCMIHLLVDLPCLSRLNERKTVISAEELIRKLFWVDVLFCQRFGWKVFKMRTYQNYLYMVEVQSGVFDTYLNTATNMTDTRKKLNVQTFCLTNARISRDKYF